MRRSAALLVPQHLAGERGGAAAPTSSSSSSSSPYSTLPSSSSAQPSAPSSTLYYSGSGNGSGSGSGRGGATTCFSSKSSSDLRARAAYHSPPVSTSNAIATAAAAASSSSSSSGTTRSGSNSFSTVRSPPGTRRSHPRPYRGRNTPFPIPVGKRTIGGLAAVDEHKGDEVYSQLFGQRDTQPAPLGKTRCYWALLSTDSSPSNPYDLTFLFCDPVLQNHLSTEADLLIGKSFFDYVHPDEREQAQRDLAQIVASGTLFGSVTRCRYFRVPAIREQLGCKQALRVPGSELYSDDHNFITLDFVLNMVGESLALCFFHAIINKSVHDNDETNKTDWTNWCGTPRALFDMDQCEKLWTSVASLPKALPPLPPTASHVFQILSLPADESPPEIIFSWPPARFFPDEDNPTKHYPSTIIEAYEDGSYFADEFARLAQGVRTSPSARTETGQTARNGDPGTIQDGANTSCTRRFRAKHTLTTEGMLRSIESVLVPYGTIMLACFNTKYQQIMNRSCGGGYSDFAVSPIATNAGSAGIAATTGVGAGASPPSSSSMDSSPSAKSVYAGASAPASYMPAVATYGIRQQPQKHSCNGPSSLAYEHGRDRTGSVRDRASDSPGSSFERGSSSPWSMRNRSGEVIGRGGASGRKGSSVLATASFGDAGLATSRDDRHQVQEDHEDDDDDDEDDDNVQASSFASHVPLVSTHKLKKRLKRDEMVDANASANCSLDGSRSLQDGGALKLLIDSNSPVSEANKVCSSCGTANSPEWRKGPSGLKTLCNACGLRFSRSVNRQKKKSEKEKAKKGGGKGSATAPATAEAGTDGSDDGAEEDAELCVKAGIRRPQPSKPLKDKKEATEAYYTNVAGSSSTSSLYSHRHHHSSAREEYGAHTTKQIDSMGWGLSSRMNDDGNG